MGFKFAGIQIWWASNLVGFKFGGIQILLASNLAGLQICWALNLVGFKFGGFKFGWLQISFFNNISKEIARLLTR